MPNHEAFHVLNLILKMIVTANSRHYTLLCDINRIMFILNDFCSFKYGIRCAAVALPVVAGLLMFSFEKHRITDNDNRSIFHEQVELFMKVVTYLHDFSCPNKYDEEFRLAAALTLQFTGKIWVQNFSQHSSTYIAAISKGMPKVANLILLSGICLLQDENSDVREEASKFVIYHLKDIHKSFNSLECQHKFFSLEFLRNFLQDEQLVIQFLWKLLSHKDSDLSKNALVENPFDHGLSNIFAEETCLVEQSNELIQILVEKTQGFALFQATCEISTCVTEIQEDIRILETLIQSGFLNKGNLSQYLGS